ncbi:SET domain-containing protein SmydA-8-like [Pollicipes pollicipes]|uniref:SET domain-containing protein SmydA-8-like n=1 Tax=Pollicipes pollicipes TaxID=41117 RepID=UPI0018851078|nr:SET domain-containing protein SmydA-8-like [Pollicipes pollicipes]
MNEGPGDTLAVLDEYLRSTLGNSPNVRIAVDESVGRHLVATRDLAAGEVIARETQAVAAPQSRLLCVCCSQRSAAAASCASCGWPVCDACADQPPEARSLHAECAVLAPLLDCLQDNVASLGRTAWLGSCLQNVVEPLQTVCAQDVAVRTLVHIAGVLDTNCFAVSAEDGLSGRALYPLLCLMAHDCSPNTNRFYDAGVMTLVATQPVPAGARVTTSYTSLLWGGEARRAHLAATKFFLCTCRRCQDPSEFGTDVTALACRGGEGATGGSCGGRRVCRRHGEDLCWRCTRCEKSMTAAEVHTLHQVLALTLGRTLALRDAAKAEAWLEAHQGVLSENHYFLLEVRLALVDLYAADKEDAAGGSQRKRRELSQSLLEVTSRLEPGPTRLRGRLLCHLAESALMSDGDHQGSYESIKKMAEEAAEILQYDGILRPMANRVSHMARDRASAV